MNTNEIISQIKSIKGIKEVKLLDSEQREFIQELEIQEEKETGIINQGVKEVMQRKIVLVATHDETFREPKEELFKDNVIFSTSFHELDEIMREKNNNINSTDNINFIISSPSKESHEYLKALIKVEGEGLNEDATLLIGV